MTASVRAPTPADAAALAEVHVRAWQAAYRDEMPDAFLDGLDVATRTVAWTRWLTEPDSTFTVLVGELDDRVAGFALVGAELGVAAEQTGEDERGELRSLNVHPDAWRAGLGSALLDEAEAALRGAGHRAAVLWVATVNERARRFYEANGWRSDGTTRVEQLGPAGTQFDVGETRYVKPLR